MGNLTACKMSKAHLRNELINEDDDTDGANESSEKWSTQHIVQESKSEEACNKYESTSHRGNNSSNLGVSNSILVGTGSFSDVFSNHFTGKKRTGSLWTDHHLRTRPKDRIYQGIDGETI